MQQIAWTLRSVSGCVDDSDTDSSNLEMFPIFNLGNLESIDIFLGSFPHDHRNLELSVPRDEISMIVCKADIFQSCSSFR